VRLAMISTPINKEECAVSDIIRSWFDLSTSH